MKEVEYKVVVYVNHNHVKNGHVTNPIAISTPDCLCGSLDTIFTRKKKNSEEIANSRSGSGKISLEHLVIPDNRETIKYS